MVFGDNVRARKAARALPRTPTQRRRDKGRGQRKQTTRPHTPPPFHNPQHNTTRQDKTRHILPPQHEWRTDVDTIPINHHHYSTMTQPCHKDTTLNQQCCNRKHNTEENSRTQFHNEVTHRYSQRHHRTSPPTTKATSHKRKGSGTVRRGAGQCEGAPPQSERGDNTPHHPRHSTRPPHKRKGDTNTNGRVTIAVPALHSPCHPPSTMPPPSTTVRGSTQRIPHHTNTADITHLHHTLGNKTVRDMIAVLTSVHWE